MKGGMKGGGKGGCGCFQGYHGSSAPGHWEPMGGTPGQANWRYGQSSQQMWESAADRFPKVAHKLETLRNGLSQDSDAFKAYRALVMSLQRHSTPHGSRPNFERDFHENLAAVFPNAMDISAKQIGSYNQWEVKVDGGPKMFCSVRLEVLSDDPAFIRDVKNKAKIVKSTLLENGAKWMKSLQPDHGGFSFEKLTQFEKECAYRSESSEFAGGGLGGRVGTAMGGRTIDEEGPNNWVDHDNQCEICSKSLEEDQLNGVHMCIVFATFQCCNPDCKYSWNSYHGRLKPDREVMGQRCRQCDSPGEMKDWRVNAGLDDYRPDTYSMASYRSRGSAGMHQSDLCDACREFGNCMGIFYDPFVITTALSLVSGNFVQWKCFSDSTPELLIADLGTGMKDIQVCLQPHVYVLEGNRDLNQRPPMRNSRPQQQPIYEDFRRDNTKGLAGGGVKNQNLLNNLIAQADQQPPLRGQADQQPPLRGPPPSEHPPPPPRSLASATRYSAFAPESGPTLGNLSVGILQDERPATAQQRAASPSESSITSVSVASTSLASARAGKASKSNKIGSLAGGAVGGAAGAGAGGASSSSARFAGSSLDGSAPADSNARQSGIALLDALLPIRKAQFLQLVLRYLKVHGRPEDEKFRLAEEFLQRNDGNYEKSYQYVKSLIDNQFRGPA